MFAGFKEVSKDQCKIPKVLYEILELFVPSEVEGANDYIPGMKGISRDNKET